MTDEERQKLCARLRREYYDGELVASEIDRLVKELKEERQKPKLRIRREELRPFVIEE